MRIKNGSERLNSNPQATDGPQPETHQSKQQGSKTMTFDQAMNYVDSSMMDSADSTTCKIYEGSNGGCYVDAFGQCYRLASVEPGELANDIYMAIVLHKVTNAIKAAS